MAKLLKFIERGINRVELWDKTTKDAPYNYIVEVLEDGKPVGNSRFFFSKRDSEKYYKSMLNNLDNGKEKEEIPTEANSGGIQKANRSRAWKPLQWTYWKRNKRT